MRLVPVTMNKTAANMVEIFSSIQGEGMYVGSRQAFLRFHGCTLNCCYCDTRDTHTSRSSDNCRVEMTPGRRNFVPMKNPLVLKDISNIFDNWACSSRKIHHSISLTGGEPLLQADVLSGWLPLLNSILPIYLETNGVLYSELSKCIDLIEYISMDVKLPSVSGLDGLWDNHLNFLRIASRTNVFVKAVVSNATTNDEIQKTCELICSVDRSIPLVLQPLTSELTNGSISPTLLLEFQEIASCNLDFARIIPQTHHILNFI
jgi:7-carboxy-7-deazaguanine synthase